VFSLRTRLNELKGHLPHGFDATKGVRSLFPGNYSDSIMGLKSYVFLYDTGSSVSDVQAWIGADGSGQWFLGWWNDGVVQVGAGFRSGFVFYYSDDGIGHGYVDKSGYTPGATLCNAGTDTWIAEHWPQAFAAGVRFDSQWATGFDSLPDESYVWTDAGFAASKFAALDGESCQCTNVLEMLFPFSDFYIGHTAPEASIPLPFNGDNPFSGYGSGGDDDGS
jgi:hypothetical protein